jgi:hypothetical protein
MADDTEKLHHLLAHMGVSTMEEAKKSTMNEGEQFSVWMVVRFALWMNSSHHVGTPTLTLQHYAATGKRLLWIEIKKRRMTIKMRISTKFSMFTTKLEGQQWQLAPESPPFPY